MKVGNKIFSRVSARRKTRSDGVPPDPPPYGRRRRRRAELFLKEPLPEAHRGGLVAGAPQLVLPRPVLHVAGQPAAAAAVMVVGGGGGRGEPHTNREGLLQV